MRHRRKWLALVVVLAGVAVAACGSGAARRPRRTPGAPSATGVPARDATPAPEPIWRIVGFSFVSPTRGWLVRHDGSGAGGGSQVLATLDGGDTWMRENTPATFAPATVHFVDRQHGWLAGSDTAGGSTMLSTVDGGMTWSPQPLPAGPVTAVTFTDARHGWALSRGSACTAQATDCERKPTQVMHTDDGGATWTASTVEPATYDRGGWSPQLTALDAQRASVLTSDAVYATADAGATWSHVGTPGTTCGIPRQITMIDASLGWALCSGGGAEGFVQGELDQTTDGARTWKLVSQFVFGDPTPVPGVGQLPGAGGHFQFLNETHGWLTTGDHGPNIYATSDGGNSWRPFTTSLSDSLEALQFVDASHGWVANGTQLARTTDGGQHWTTLTLP